MNCRKVIINSPIILSGLLEDLKIGKCPIKNEIIIFLGIDNKFMKFKILKNLVIY